MKVLKFGGASVKDAEAVRNVSSILSGYANEKIAVVISAMGKTTNALEKIVDAFFDNKDKIGEHFDFVRDFHFRIIDDLGFAANHPLREQVNNAFVEIEWVLEEEPSKGYSFIYDQIVSQGEIISTRIVHAYLTENGTDCHWLDVRDVLITDNFYREARVDWPLTAKLVNLRFPVLFSKINIVVTQGFIGCTSENFTTTLGREGSDFTAAVLSHCLDAEEMIVWKDVPGILSADPKYSKDAIKLEQVSYHDAIELTYYGATVIHPKTIKPLENKHIPLRVCSFKTPTEKGSVVGNFSATKPLVPCFIYKFNQILFSISAYDFSFIAEQNISRIFAIFAEFHIKINLMQNSALSFSICIDNDPHKIPELYEALNREFRVLYNEGLKLITIRHYYPSTIDEIIRNSNVLLEQRSRLTAQLVIKE
jgi:aspartate kinase